MSFLPDQVQRCRFCSQHAALSERPSIATTQPIFHEQHEGAYLGQCKTCGAAYLVYWLEYRDDTLSYFCPITSSDLALLEERRSANLLSSAEVRACIVEHEVFAVSPWGAKWERGVFLPSPTPW